VFEETIVDLTTRAVQERKGLGDGVGIWEAAR